MSSRIQHYLRVGIRYIVAAFLIVTLTQILLYLNIIGDSFLESVAITLVSLVIASILLGAAYQPK
jgi:hypothetical protein